MTSIRTVLFDLDGTLIDSVPLIMESYRHVESTHGLVRRSDDEWMAGVGTPLVAQFAAWKDERGTMETLIETYRAFNLAHHDRMVRAFPGVVDAVAQLRAAGIGTGLVTSKLREGALRGLRLVGLDAMMDVLVGADDVANHKPHPEPVAKAVQLLGADPSSTIYVGDSIHDLRAGREAGVLTAAVLWGVCGRSQMEPERPDVWLEKPEEIALLRAAKRAALDGV